MSHGGAPHIQKLVNTNHWLRYFVAPFLFGLTREPRLCRRPCYIVLALKHVKLLAPVGAYILPRLRPRQVCCPHPCSTRCAVLLVIF